MSRDGEWIVFTSVRDGDLDLYRMRSDGSDVRRLTSEEGYDGGAFFSYDGTQIVYRAHHPEGEALEEYRQVLAQWKTADDVLKPFIRQAEQGLARLGEA